MISHQSRLHAMLHASLGPVILEALADPLATEVLVNPDGRIWHERHGEPMIYIGTQAPTQTEATIRLLATCNGLQVTWAQPSLDAVLPTGQRFKGFLPPRTRAPAYCIRSHHAQVLTREDYVPAACPAEVWELLADAVATRKNILLVGGMSCHGEGTPVIMADGSVKAIEHITVTDKVMGIDSTPRTVLETHQGYQPLYEIIPLQGDAFSVTPDHLLSLISTPRTKGEQPHTVLVTVKEYLTWTHHKQGLYKLWRVGVEFPPASLPIRPYHLGVLLGGCEGKFIPDIYKKASREQRLELLAGLMDTDGYAPLHGGYDYISKSRQLAYDVVYVARSLGLRASVSPCTKGCPISTGDFIGKYWRVTIGGDCSVIPCKIPRKKARASSTIRRGWISGFLVKPLTTLAPFYGFTLDGDGLYLLGDFTVTHNSGKSTLMNALAQLIPPEVRVATMEDTSELIPNVPNVLQLYTSTNADLQAVVKEGFRTAAHRILVGEIRDGITAINTFKLWLGVGGGICTTHADSARDVLTRLGYLCQEVGAGEYGPLLGDVIDLVAYMENRQGHRILAEVMAVHGWKEGAYETEMVWQRIVDAGPARARMGGDLARARMGGAG